MTDFIGNAFDRAVDKLADVAGIPETAAVAAPEPTKEVTEPAKVEAPEAPEETKEIQKALEKQPEPYKSPKQERREKAFGVPKAPKQVSDQSATTETAAPLTTQKVDVSPSEIPVFWSGKMRAAAEATPDKAFLKAIIEHDAQREETIKRAHTEAQSNKALIEKLNSDFESPEAMQEHRARRAIDGIKDDAEELHRYRAWNKVFTKDVPTGLVDLMRKNNLTPEYIAGLFYGNAEAQPQAPQFDPEEAKRIATETAQSEFQKMQKESSEAAFRAELGQFLQQKDSYGNVRMPFFQLHRQQIQEAATVIEKEYPHLAPKDVVHHAYEYAISEARKAYGVAAPQPQRAVADPVKAKNASGSVSGSPSLGVAPQRSRFKSEKFTDKIDEAFNRAESRLGAR